MRKKKPYHGFTIIEFMIALAIIGGSLAVAVPAYQNHQLSEQVLEGVYLSSDLRDAISAARHTQGGWPSSAEIKGGLTHSLSGQYARSMDISDQGVITISYDGPQASYPVRGERLLLMPYFNKAGNIIWHCQSDIDRRYWPTFCLSD